MEGDALERLERWVSLLLQENPLGLGENLKVYADAWRAERTSFTKNSVDDVK